MSAGTAAGRTEGADLTRPLVHAALIILLGSIIYANTLSVPFAFDDASYIVENPALRNFGYFTDPSLAERAIAGSRLDPNFATRTAGFFSFALNYAVHDLHVAGYHIVNILIHIVNGLLVYQLVLLTLRTPFMAGRGVAPGTSRRGRLTALFAALLFVSHPVQTQAVTYLSQRFSSLATLFCLASLVLYIKARLMMGGGAQGGAEQRAAGRRYLAPYALSLASAVLAMKTKEIAFTLPLLIALYELLFLAGPRRIRYLSLLPLLATMLIIPLTLLGAKAQYADVARLAESFAGRAGENPALTYLFTQFRVIVTYLRLLVLPVGQNLDYDYPAYPSFLRPPVFLSFLFLLAIVGTAVALYLRSKREGERNSAWQRLAAFGIFWYFIALSVESSIVPLKDLIFEHRLYLPSAGIFLSVAAAGEMVRERIGSARAAWVTAFFVLLTAVWSVTAVARNAVWGDTYRLCEDTVRKSPHKARPHLNLGSAYVLQGRYAEAIGEMAEALRLDPRYHDAYLNLGLLHVQRGEYLAALNLLQKGVAMDPKDAALHGNLGLVYEKMNRLDDAEKEFLLAVSLDKDLASAHSNLGVVYMKQGRMPDALASVSEAVRLAPDNADYQFNLGNAFAVNERFSDAVEAYRRTLLLDPAHPRARTFLEQTLIRTGK